MRPLVTVALALVTVAAAGSCGAAVKTNQRRVATFSQGGFRVGDDDDDDRERPRADPDDAAVRDYGRPADRVEENAIAELVRRYYAAAVNGDGQLACSLVYRPYTRGARILEALPSGYAPASGSTTLRGMTCAQVAALLFKLDRQSLSAESHGLGVVSARVDARRGYAILGFKDVPERWLAIKRGRQGEWRVAALLDSEMR
jgi:hypothetical protein